MNSIVRQIHPLSDALGGELTHTPDLAWLVKAVRSASDYEELACTDVVLTALEPYGFDTWASLQVSPAFDGLAIAAVREALTYKGEHVAFYPIALLTHDAPIRLELACRYSDDELQQQDARLFRALIEGRVTVTAAARQMLGDGYIPRLSKSDGSPSLELMELSLEDSSLLIGFGWVWYPAGTV